MLQKSAAVDEGKTLLVLEACYKKSDSVVSREIAGEAILVPIRRNVGDLNNIYTLNETASFIWTLFDSQRTLREIQDEVVREFDVEEQEARTDILELLAQLEAVGAVERI
jgi:hypothetical protein